MDRLQARCQAVEIQVHTMRDEGQRQALIKVNAVGTTFRLVCWPPKESLAWDPLSSKPVPTSMLVCPKL